MSVSALLKKNAVKESKPKKSTVPVVTDHAALADQANDLKKLLKDAETRYAVAEASLLKLAQAGYEAAAATGDFSKSFNFQGLKTAGVQVTFTDRFSAIPVDDEESIQKSMGSNYDKYFEEKRQLTLTKTDDATITMLCEKLGEQLFTEIFAIKVSLTPKDDMDRNQFALSPNVRRQLKQAKASVKILSEEE